ncbi:hypothetical protein CHARACLAT_000281 [Characodon lateralis]|uniref:Uncharacterized protein n=1 Tax=Characodon lateralis TaxID=208331 RepID=A0ABU7DCY2_9TELE|nr:hypothetical protein [Characodon lateralis]
MIKVGLQCSHLVTHSILFMGSFPVKTLVVPEGVSPHVTWISSSDHPCNTVVSSNKKRSTSFPFNLVWGGGQNDQVAIDISRYLPNSIGPNFVIFGKYLCRAIEKD